MSTNVRKVLGKTAQLVNTRVKQNLFPALAVGTSTKPLSSNNNYSTKVKKENFNIPTQLHNKNNKLMNIFMVDFKNYSSVNNNETTVDLNPVQYESWSKEQVCSLLCTPKENGGAGLTLEKVKSIYDAGFDGTSLANIVTYITTFGLEKALSLTTTDFSNVPKQIVVTVVLWADNLLKTRLYHLWSAEQTKRHLVELSIEMESLNISNSSLKSMIEDIYNDNTYFTEFPTLTPETFNKIRAWLHTISNIGVTLKSFDIRVFIQTNLEKLPENFKVSMDQWATATDTTIKIQQSKLGPLYRNPLLPDHYNGFLNNDLSRWTNHFNDLRIPKDKGKELVDLLSNNTGVGRGEDFKNCIIPLVDLSTSGKTYTVFQLANTKPSNPQYHSFFVINLLDGTRLFTRFLNYVDNSTISASDLVSLLALTINICVSTLIEMVPTVKPIDFLKFIRNGGDESLLDIFTKLVDNYDQNCVDNLNISITKKLALKGVKVVFSFDEAHLLLVHAKNKVKVDGEEKGSLFHAVYQQIRQFNNPVFLGTTFSISDAILNVSKEGRKLIRPVIGSLQPWYITEVEQALSYLFDIDDVKIQYEEEFSMLCYLLSGAPENVTLFHRKLIENSPRYKLVTPEDKLLILRDTVDQVVQTKRESCEKRLKSFVYDTRLIDRTEHLLRLLFKKECVFQNINIDLLDKSTNITYTYSQAFIEKTIAYVDKVSNRSQIFDIVDPIAAKTFFEGVFDLLINDIWRFMSKEFSGTGQEFEFFMAMLLIHEGKLLNGKSFTKSPLFKLATDTSLDKWCINTKSLLNDQNLSKKILEKNNNIPGVWYTQLAQDYFRDTFVRPYSEMGPDGFFYLQHEGAYQLVTCAMTLVSDPFTDKYQKDKARNMVKTLSLNNIGKDKSGNPASLNYSLPNNLANTHTIGWIVAPNMNPSVFKQFTGNFIVTDRNCIEECLQRYKGHSFYNDMDIVWKKFK